MVLFARVRHAHKDSAFAAYDSFLSAVPSLAEEKLADKGRIISIDIYPRNF